MLNWENTQYTNPLVQGGCITTQAGLKAEIYPFNTQWGFSISRPLPTPLNGEYSFEELAYGNHRTRDGAKKAAERELLKAVSKAA